MLLQLFGASLWHKMLQSVKKEKKGGLAISCSIFMIFRSHRYIKLWALEPDPCYRVRTKTFAFGFFNEKSSHLNIRFVFEKMWQVFSISLFPKVHILQCFREHIYLL